MAISTKIVLLLLLALTCAGCRKNAKLGTLSVDLYLHPESGSSEDVLLETAIRKNLNDTPATQRGIYARVLDLRVVLSGTVSTAAIRDQAEKIAAGTRVTVNEKAISPQSVNNLVKVEP